MNKKIKKQSPQEGQGSKNEMTEEEALKIIGGDLNLWGTFEDFSNDPEYLKDKKIMEDLKAKKLN